MWSDWYDLRTHCEVMGTTQAGKSKFVELCVREKIVNCEPVILLDYHGKLYYELVYFLAFVRPGRPVYLVNPSDPGHGAGIVPCNFFRRREGEEASTHAIRQADIIVRPWGAENPNALPTYRRMAQMILTLCGDAEIPIHLAFLLLFFPQRELRDWAVGAVQDPIIKEFWKELQTVRSLTEWKREVLSSQNRLMTFVASKGVKLFTGLPGESIDFGKARDENAIVLVNLKPSYHLPPESARAFGSLILSELLQDALNHTEEDSPLFAYFDECQNYLTSDAAAILDQSIKSGLRCTFIHQHQGQKVFRDLPELLDSLQMNARIKIDFGGEPPTYAKEAAEAYFINELNKRWTKEIRYQWVNKYRLEQQYTTTEGNTESEGETEGESHDEGSNDAWNDGSGRYEGKTGDQESEGEDFSSAYTMSNSERDGWTRQRSKQRGTTKSVSLTTRYAPLLELEESGREDWSREEKLSKLAARLMNLPERHCYIKLPRKEAFEFEVPDVDPILLDPETVLEYEKEVQPNAIPLHEAERIQREEETRFLERGKAYESKPKSRPKKRPLYAH